MLARDLVVGAIVGAAVAVPIAFGTWYLDRQMAERQEILENVRFIRDRSGDAPVAKPFGNLNLRHAQLSGLRLNCVPFLDGSGLRDKDCADLREADLRDADMFEIELRGAVLAGADLRGADLMDADLQQVDLRNADFRGADLTRATLNGAKAHGADFRDAKVTDWRAGFLCGDEETRWPDGFQPSVSC